MVTSSFGKWKCGSVVVVISILLWSVVIWSVVVVSSCLVVISSFGQYLLRVFSFGQLFWSVVFSSCDL